MIIDNDPGALGAVIGAQGGEHLKSLANSDQRAAIREVAQQFEALLMSTLLKSMRATTSQDGFLDNEQTKLYTSLLDQEIANSIAKRGTGLAEVLERQLSRLSGDADVKPWERVGDTGIQALSAWNAQLNRVNHSDLATSLHAVQSRAATDIAADIAVEKAQPRRPGPANESTVRSADVAKQDPIQAETASRSGSRAEQFVAHMRPFARDAERHTGIPANFVVGHAALETGWGRYEIRRADGAPSHNLFGIKADARWKGDVAEVMTTEYVGGLPVKRVELFRAYESYEAAFRDYGDFLRGNPRYARALEATHDVRAFANELQSAGYATDPRYAEKLTAVINHQSLQASVWT